MRNLRITTGTGAVHADGYRGLPQELFSNVVELYPHGSMSFETTPLGGTLGKREPQIILRTDERSVHLELGPRGKPPIKQLG
jgi:hypothetical protein